MRPPSSQRQHSDRIIAVLARRSGVDPDAPRMADAVISVWQDIVAALHSIVGAQGVAALYDRSLSVASRAHPWLSVARSAPDRSMDLCTLQAAVARQDNREAAAGCGELLTTFYEVLAGLIGATLCDQLLSPSQSESPAAESRGVSHE